MAQVRPLKIQSRERTGTGGARATRRQGLVPGVVYGGQDKPASIAIETRELEKAMAGGRFTSSLFEVELSGAKARVVPRAVQFDPVTDRPVHFDLFRLEAGSKVALYIPVSFVNQEVSPGIKRGGVLNIVRHEVELLCPPDNIPAEIVGDLAELNINDSLHIDDFKLPAGVEYAHRGRNPTIASIAPPAVDAELVAEEEARAAAAAAAAPAKGGKAAPAPKKK